MRLPKTTEFKLERILENIDQIPSREVYNKPILSQDEKVKLQEMAANFDKYGQELNYDQQLMETCKNILEVMKLAKTYALNESGDWFQEDIVKRDFKDAEKKVNDFQKLAQECYTRMQKLGIIWEDLRHVVGRYYKINDDK